MVQINAWLQFVEVGAPIDDARQVLLRASISRLMEPLTRLGLQVQDMGQPCLGEPDV